MGQYAEDIIDGFIDQETGEYTGKEMSEGDLWRKHRGYIRQKKHQNYEKSKKLLIASAVEYMEFKN